MAEDSVPVVPVASRGVTLGEVFRYLSPKLADQEEPPAWPPDAFALAASALMQSGVYLSVVAQWPPAGTEGDGCLPVSSEDWSHKIQEIGESWRRSWSRRSALPAEVVRWWKILRQHMDAPLAEIGGASRVCNSLLQICAAADEACWGVGFPLAGGRDRFNVEAESQLIPDSASGSTLCYDIHFSRARVLPKSHTPQNGITLSSLSHHIALVPGGDVRPHWFTLPSQRLREVKRQDGPQLASRWPSRYATVLADDPGSSVLTLTSVGMAELSRPPGVAPTRTIALWKDAKSGAARQIDLPPGAEGVVLNLSRQLEEEWSADGRSDGGTAGYPILGGIHPVFLEEEPKTKSFEPRPKKGSARKARRPAAAKRA